MLVSRLRTISSRTTQIRLQYLCSKPVKLARAQLPVTVCRKWAHLKANMGKPITNFNVSRTGGHVRPEIYFYMQEYIKRYGLEMAAAISNFEISHIQALKDLVEKEQIDCDFTLGRSMDVFLDEAQAVKAKAAYDALKKSGLVSLKDVQYTSVKDAEIVSTPHRSPSLPTQSTHSYGIHSLCLLSDLTAPRCLASEEPRDVLVSQLPTFGHTNSSCTSSPLLLRAASTYKPQQR